MNLRKVFFIYNFIFIFPSIYFLVLFYLYYYCYHHIIIIIIIVILTSLSIMNDSYQAV